MDRWLGYIQRHWRGELDFGLAFGVNVAGLHALYRVLELAGLALLPSWLLIPLAISLGLLRFVTAVWQVIGVWRTCGRYIGADRLVPLAYFFRGLIIFGFIWTAGRALLAH
jgi:hypothetical protein